MKQISTNATVNTFINLNKHFEINEKYTLISMKEPDKSTIRHTNANMSEDTTRFGKLTTIQRHLSESEFMYYNCENVKIQKTVIKETNNNSV